MSTYCTKTIKKYKTVLEKNYCDKVVPTIIFYKLQKIPLAEMPWYSEVKHNRCVWEKPRGATVCIDT